MGSLLLMYAIITMYHQKIEIQTGHSKTIDEVQ